MRNSDPRTESDRVWAVWLVPSMPHTGSVYHVPCAPPPARRPRADPCVSPGAPGQIFRRRGRRWRARRPTCRRTRLPYESRPPRAAVARRPAPPLKRSGWSTLASTSVRFGSIISRGRPRPGGRERRAVARRVCWAGAPAPNGASPAAQTTDAEPDRAAFAAAGLPTHSSRLCHLPVQSEPRSPSTLRHCGVLAKLAQMRARCLSTPPHPRVALHASVIGGVVAHTA